jgi:predicted dehydrogenase
VHSLCYRELPLLYPGTVPEPVLAAVCTRRSESAQAAAAEAGFAKWYTNVSDMLGDPQVDFLDCAAPNHLHREALLLAIQSKKHAYCEKPLALSVAEASEIVESAARAGVRIGLSFNFRFIPALLKAKHLLQSRALGRIYAFRAEYYHTGYQDPGRPMSWRLRKELAGGGALVDLGAHLLDLVRHLLGEYDSVRALTHTYIAERPLAAGSAARAKVDVEDAAWLQVRLKDGSLGSIEVSRFATGALDDLALGVYGEKGALRFRLMDANYLYWFDAARSGGDYGGERGWQRLETVQHYPGAQLPPPRSILGWTRTHAENQYGFLRALTEGREPSPNALDGLRVQQALEACYRSAESGNWEKVG